MIRVSSREDGKRERKMKKMKVYDVYMDDGRDVLKVKVPAISKTEAIKYCAGNGEVVAVKDSDLQDINIECLANTLSRNAWGQAEIDVITRCLIQCGLDRQ